MQNGFSIGEWHIHPERNALVRSGREHPIESKIMEVLVYLSEHTGDVVSKEQMIQTVWGRASVTDEVLTNAISELRKALGDDAKNPRFIQTIPKKGYRLLAEVRATDDVRRRALTVWMALAVGVLVLGAIFLSFSSAPDAVKEGTFTQLTFEPGNEEDPSLSPDGSFVVYASMASGNWDIYRQRVGGETAFKLTKDSEADDRQPAFSPDGEHIAFRSERDGGGIFVMGATGESVRRVTDFGYDPAWSPDGRDIVCTTVEVQDPPYAGFSSGQIWIVNVSTGNTQGDRGACGTAALVSQRPTHRLLGDPGRAAKHLDRIR